jgi:NCAIR mutase (PurE)-related protein
MDPRHLRALLEQVRAGERSVEAALGHLAQLPFADLGFARVDHHRALRTGFPEVVFGQGKSAAQVSAILVELVRAGHNALATRVVEADAPAILAAVPGAQYHPLARAVVVEQRAPEPRGGGTVLIVAAGTADLPVAEEAALTARLAGRCVERLTDVGVAGLHRLLAAREQLQRAAVLVVVAGMEGALPSVVAGLVRRPVIAVPTSIGYGASYSGLAALLGMLSSCAPGVLVVNIDNGFGAGYAAALIDEREGAR